MPDLDTTDGAPTASRTMLAEMTTDLVAAYVTKNAVRPGEIASLIASVHDALVGLGSAPVAKTVPELKPAVPIRKSVTDDYIVCLDDGLKFKSLKRHLDALGMTPDQYRAKWGLPKDYPMVATSYAKARSEVARAVGLRQKGRVR